MAEEVFEVINEKAFVSSEYPLIIVVRKKSNRSYTIPIQSTGGTLL